MYGTKNLYELVKEMELLSFDRQEHEKCSIC